MANTTADKLAKLAETKSSIKQAIIDKGVSVSDTDTFASYAAKIGQIQGGGSAPATKYGASIGNLLGNVDENGVYQLPTEPFTLDLSSVKSVPRYGLYYKFYKSSVSGALKIGLEGDFSGYEAMHYCFQECVGLTNVNLSSLTTISGYGAIQSCFQNCTGLTSVDLSSLTTVSGDYAMSSCFSGCTGLTNVDLSSLTTVSGTSAMNACFQGCTGLTSIDLSSLTIVSGSSAMYYCFYNCKGLTSVNFSSLTTISSIEAMSYGFNRCTGLTTISFPALTSIVDKSFGSASYNYTFSGCTNLTEIHFRADMQATIEAMSGYANKWGASNATIYFDL